MAEIPPLAIERFKRLQRHARIERMEADLHARALDEARADLQTTRGYLEQLAAPHGGLRYNKDNDPYLRVVISEGPGTTRLVHLGAPEEPDPQSPPPVLGRRKGRMAIPAYWHDPTPQPRTEGEPELLVLNQQLLKKTFSEYQDRKARVEELTQERGEASATLTALNATITGCEEALRARGWQGALR